MIREQYRKVMALFYDPFMEGLEKSLGRHRRFLLEKTGGKVLEVGAGTGVNFNYYPSGVEVFAVEPSVPMFKRARKRALGKKHIRLYNIGIEQVPDHPAFPGKFDFIVSMLVLCTVKDLQKTVDIYARLLKPQGKLLVLEHIHSGDTFYGKFQKWINPVWRPFADGCNLTRRQDLALKEAGFIPESEHYFRLGTDWYRAVMTLP